MDQTATDPVRALMNFARENGITQIFIGHSMRRGWWHRLRGNPVERLIDLADTLRFSPRDGDGIRLATRITGLSEDDDLCVRAARSGGRARRCASRCERARAGNRDGYAALDSSELR